MENEYWISFICNKAFLATHGSKENWNVISISALFAIPLKFSLKLSSCGLIKLLDLISSM